LSCRGLTPLEVGMGYHPVETFGGTAGVQESFGGGWVLDYDVAFFAFQGTRKVLILPPNERVNFVDDGSGNYRATDDARFDGATIRLKDAGAEQWELVYKDREKWRFMPFGNLGGVGGRAALLTEIEDPFGNLIQITHPAHHGQRARDDLRIRRQRPGEPDRR
jgi:hypothetical protein